MRWINHSCEWRSRYGRHPYGSCYPPICRCAGPVKSTCRSARKSSDTHSRWDSSGIEKIGCTSLALRLMNDCSPLRNQNWPLEEEMMSLRVATEWRGPRQSLRPGAILTPVKALRWSAQAIADVRFHRTDEKTRSITIQPAQSGARSAMQQSQ